MAPQHDPVKNGIDNDANEDHDVRDHQDDSPGRVLVNTA